MKADVIWATDADNQRSWPSYIRNDEPAPDENVDQNLGNFLEILYDGGHHRNLRQQNYLEEAR